MVVRRLCNRCAFSDDLQTLWQWLLFDWSPAFYQLPTAPRGTPSERLHWTTLLSVTESHRSLVCSHWRDADVDLSSVRGCSKPAVWRLDRRCTARSVLCANVQASGLPFVATRHPCGTGCHGRPTCITHDNGVTLLRLTADYTLSHREKHVTTFSTITETN